MKKNELVQLIKEVISETSEFQLIQTTYSDEYKKEYGDTSGEDEETISRSINKWNDKYVLGGHTLVADNPINIEIPVTIKHCSIYFDLNEISATIVLNTNHKIEFSATKHSEDDYYSNVVTIFPNKYIRKDIALFNSVSLIDGIFECADPIFIKGFEINIPLKFKYSNF